MFWYGGWSENAGAAAASSGSGNGVTPKTYLVATKGKAKARYARPTWLD